MPPPQSAANSTGSSNNQAATPVPLYGCLSGLSTQLHTCLRKGWLWPEYATSLPLTQEDMPSEAGTSPGRAEQPAGSSKTIPGVQQQEAEDPQVGSTSASQHRELEAYQTIPEEGRMDPSSGILSRPQHDIIQRRGEHQSQRKATPPLQLGCSCMMEEQQHLHKHPVVTTFPCISHILLVCTKDDRPQHLPCH
jgi:hypothetical protein